MPALKTPIALVLLTLAGMFGIGSVGLLPRDPSMASRCGELPLGNQSDNFNILSRIVGGRPADKGHHPWTVSLKRDGKHFCGGTIVSATHVITAAHCVNDKNVLVYIRVYVGDYDFTLKEPSEKMFFVKSILKHPNFRASRPINFDIAILELEGNITFDEQIQPVCLPNTDDLFEPGLLCVTLGWGRLRENGVLPSVLQEVSLPIIDSRKCTNVMATLKGLQQYETILCAGFPEGGRDACQDDLKFDSWYRYTYVNYHAPDMYVEQFAALQGDSGGPLVCQRPRRSWVLVGITSWGMGCGRNWDKNMLKPPEKRGSPGIFTDIQKVLLWVSVNLEKDTPVLALPTVSCGAPDGLLSGTEGTITFPENGMYYTNNERCQWNINVPKGMQILFNFSHFDVESDYSCDLDYLAMYSDEGRLVGKFCGSVCPGPILVSSNSVMLKFLSDFQEYRTGFVLSYTAVEPYTFSDSKCGSLAVHFEEGQIQSMNYPENYASFANCHWFISAPRFHTIQLTFEDFELEMSIDCVYDSVRVFQDLGAEDEIGRYCGFSIPKPVVSSSNVMHLKFISDSTENYKGFRAHFSFVPSSASIVSQEQNRTRTNQKEMEISDKTCGVSPTPPRFLYNKLIGGEEAIPYSWPWHVSLQFAGEHVCDGAIISEEWILTSAFCVSERKDVQNVWLVIAGLHELTQQEHDQKRSVKQIFVHPQFAPQSMDYNIALFQLTKPFKFNTFIRPLCLPDKNSKVQPSSVCVISGWGLQGKAGEGKATKLHQLEVPVLVNDICQSYYKTHPGGITERMFCAGFPAGQSNDSCSGQSGGPLVCLLENTGIFSVFGIASWGVNCKENPKPGVYTNVPVFIDWISQIMNGRVHKESGKSSDLPNPFIRKNGAEQDTQATNNSLFQGTASSNDSGSSQNIYFASGCEDVVLLLSPGEIKLDTKGQVYPNGFSCQWRVIAPKDQIIKLELKQLHMARGNRKCCNSLAVYEGASNDKTLKAQLTEDLVPCTMWSSGSAVTIEFSTTTSDPEIELWLVYSFHDLE